MVTVLSLGLTSLLVLACVKYKRTTRKAKAAALLLRETRKEELAAIRAEGAKRRSRRSGRHP